MHEALTADQAAQVVTALCTLIVAGTLCYIIRLVMQLKEDATEIRQSLAVHFAEDKAMHDRIERMEENIDRIMKLRIIRRRENDD
jgi:hypothetical protein